MDAKEIKINKISEELQNDCQSTVESIFDFGTRTNMEYQDVVNAWMFREMAKLILRIQELENGKTT